MPEGIPQCTRRDIEAHLVTKAWKNEAFKQQLLSNPKVAIEQEIGVRLPEELSIQILAENASILYISLPVHPNLYGVELLDQELECIAAGTAIFERTFSLPVFERFESKI